MHSAFAITSFPSAGMPVSEPREAESGVTADAGISGQTRRLHPLSVLFGIGNDLRQVAIPLVAVILFSRSRPDEWRLMMPLFAVALTALAELVKYFSFTYRSEENDLVIRSGVFVRNERHIPYERIQNIDAVQNLGHQLFGVLKVQVQTGAGTEPEATLSVLPREALDEMRTRAFARRAGAPRAAAAPGTEANARTTVEAPNTASSPGVAPYDATQPATAGAPVGRVLLALPARELLLSGFIDNRGLVLVLGAIGVLTQLDPLPDMAADRFADWIPGVTRADFSFARLTESRTVMLLAMSIAALLLLVRLISTLWAGIRLHDFQLSRHGDDLRLEYGLFTRVTATIPARRIQTIAIHETVLHRWLDRAAVRVTTAGGGTGGSGSAEREWLAPILRRSQLAPLLAELQPGVQLEAVAWRRPHPAAFARVARRSGAMALVVAGASAFMVREWAITIGVILLARALVRAQTHIRNLGWATFDDGIIFRGGWLRRVTTIGRFSRIQAVELVASPFDRRADMAHVSADTAAAALGVAYLRTSDAHELKEIVLARAASTAFTW